MRSWLARPPFHLRAASWAAPHRSRPVQRLPVRQRGHAEGCRPLAAEVEAYQRKQDEPERRAKVMDEVLPRGTDTFGKETATQRRGSDGFPHRGGFSRL